MGSIPENNDLPSKTERFMADMGRKIETARVLWVFVTGKQGYYTPSTQKVGTGFWIG